jgi:hypothetical protein
MVTGLPITVEITNIEVVIERLCSEDEIYQVESC